MNDENSINRSPYSRGARYGLWFGVYMTALFFAMAYMLPLPFLSLVSIVLIIGVPFFIYAVLRRSYIEDFGTTIFSALWMEGIATFFFGGIIASLVAVVFMRWIEPNFITDRIDMLIAMKDMAGMEGNREALEILERAKEQHMIPKPIDLAVDMLWLMVFSGSILSMLMALLVRARGVNGKRKN